MDGASPEAIRAHYDVGDDFFRLWLDETMTYSCGIWKDADTLEAAQLRKLDFHIASARAGGRARVLDVGCGWGSLLRRLVETNELVEAVGLTLSKSQLEYVESLKLPRVTVLLEHWREHTPKAPYDAIVAIGALEHFVKPTDSSSVRIRIYRDFFELCHGWLKPGGWMSLQSIAYGVGSFVRGAISDIFPESDLPRLHELAAAAEGLFEVAELRNDRVDYAKTCRAWRERLSGRFLEARKLAGDGVARHYEAYLGAAARGFDLGIFVLYRMALRRIDDRVAKLANAAR